MLLTTSPGQEGTLPGTNRSGAFPLFLQSIFDDNAIEWEEALISQRSFDFVGPNGSSFTACVHEVGLGNLDMCAGPRTNHIEPRYAETIQSLALFAGAGPLSGPLRLGGN